MARRTSNADPVLERRRRLIFETIGLVLLVTVAVILVVMAMQSS